MSYNYHTEITSRNHSGPRGVAITGITWHHWGDDGLFNDSQDDDEARGIAKYLSRSGGNTSAHIVISGRDVFQIVPDAMYAWHAGNSEGNRRTIGIEVDPDAEKQKDTYQTCAEVARDLEKHYGRLRFYRHSDWKNTACPGDLDTGRIRRMADANPAPAQKEEGFLMGLNNDEQEELLRKVRELHSGEHPKVDNPFVEDKKFTARAVFKSFMSRLDRIEKALEALLKKES